MKKYLFLLIQVFLGIELPRTKTWKEMWTSFFFLLEGAHVTTPPGQFLNLGPKMLYFGIFWLEFQKLLSYLKSAPSNLSNCKFREKPPQKCLNLGPKMCNTEFFGLEFEKNIVIFEITTLEFVYWQNIVK